MSAPPVEARGLTKHYGRTVGLEGLDLTVEAGEVFGFLGPNGAGKTTTIRLLLDLIRPTRGAATLFGAPVGDPRARARAGHLPGDRRLDPRMTGRRMLDFLGSLRPRGAPAPDPRRTRLLCERLRLADADLDRPVREDSTGTRQKIGLVSAFAHDPELLLLDEPTSGLDPLVREEVFALLREAAGRGRTVFHSSHVIAEVERTCTRVGIVRAGRLVALESIDRLRRSAGRRVIVMFDGPAPPAAPWPPGVEPVEQEGSRVVLRVSGEIDALVKALARHRVVDLIAGEPDLEEIFARYYREGGEAAS